MRFGPVKLGPVTKLANVVLANCDVVVNFPIYGQFGAFRILDA